MKTKFSLIYFFLLINFCSAQSLIIDSCFNSATPGTSFFGTADLESFNADLLEWTGTTWIGGFTNANITVPPPSQKSNCRAIFIGNGITWTSNGEAFGMRTSQPLITGQSYSISFTYVSDGFGSNGAFSPRIYSNNVASQSGQILIDSLPPAGYNWTSNILTFTATPSQNGHNWILVETDTASTSGLVSSFCPKCALISNVNDLSDIGVDYFPNPFTDRLSFSVQDNDLTELYMYDMLSRLVKHEIFRANLILNTDNLENGIYLFILRNKDGEIGRGKVIRQGK